jgi:ribokinase
VRVTVVGSLNVDLVAEVQRLPRPGETVAAGRSQSCRGGKGANQALAAARQGGRVELIGCVGADEAGRDYRAFLRTASIGTRGLGAVARERTGTALITVERSGENEIVIIPGANRRLTARLVRAHRDVIARSDAVLAQLETTNEAVVEAGRLAQRAGVPFILNPSPWRAGFPWGRCAISTLVMNEAEAAHFVGREAGQFERHLPALRARMRRGQVAQCVITRGARPTLCVTMDAAFTVPTLAVRPVDTVGAGDAFAGTLAVRLAEHASLRAAVRLANCAGALATLAMGAQSALPTRAATERAARRLPV